jgi:diguanylate cyclase (GGDEF)-like protein
MPDDDTTRTDDHTLFMPGQESVDGTAQEATAQRATLVVMSGEEIGREIDLNLPEMTVGRGEACAVRLHSRSVSRQHAVIRAVVEDNQPQFRLEDLKSTNGLLVNNRQVDSICLHNGDKVQVGDVVLKFLLYDPLEAQFHQRIHQLIHFDQLTGLMTMESFRRVLTDTIQGARDGETFCLAMTDLDGLKKVNDTHGHLAGRKTVAAMGSIMRETVRPQDRAGLYGGDEAIVLFPHTTLDEAVEVAERLRRAVAERTFEHMGHEYRVSISQGLAEWPAHAATAEGIIAAADEALYAAKADGRDCVRIAGEGRSSVKPGA